MQIISTIIFIILFACTSQAAWVGCAEGKWTSGTTFTVNYTATSGNALVVGVTSNALAGGTPVAYSSPNDTINTYTLIDNQIGSNLGGFDINETTYVAKNITGGALTLTITFTATDLGIVNGQIVVCEASGRDLTTPLDVHTISPVQVNPGIGTDAITSGNVTTTAIDDVFGISQSVNLDLNLTVGTGFTAANNNTISGFGQGEYLHQSGAGTTAATFTSAGGGSRSYISAVVALKPTIVVATKKTQVVSSKGGVIR